METRTIQIEKIKDVVNFVSNANKITGDVYVYRQGGKITVDGKSLMGVFSIDPSEPIIVEFPSDAEFEKFLIRFEI